ncbi:hypothetical protein PVT71_13665 [Salipiger sp. H15]|uniref:Uncharacterized protein n=1 Tax=Alloyangia sp. H15 TaxID=3029062 RepID=A0AAU8AG94_9RHOB
MRIDASELRSLNRNLDNLRTDLPKLNAWALNDMAFAVFGENRKLMARVFDSPVPYTRNAFFVRKASPQTQVATVQRKDKPVGRHYLEVQEAGGRRPQTGFEKLLSRRMKYEGIIQSVLPTAAARRNRYGNLSPGLIQQVLSAVRAQGDAHQNTTAAARRRAGRRRAGYFVPQAESALSPGVYERRGETVRKVLAFSDTVPSYSARFPMEEHGRQVATAAAPAAYERALWRVLKAKI